MVLPASIAMRLGSSFRSVICLAILIGFIGMVGGVFTSYFVETPASATITIIFVFLFLLTSLTQYFWGKR